MSYHILDSRNKDSGPAGAGEARFLEHISKNRGGEGGEPRETPGRLRHSGLLIFNRGPGFICIREIQRHIHSVYSLDKLLLPALQQFALSEYVELLESRTRSRDSCSVTFRISSDRESCCEGSLKCSLILSLFLCCVFITCFFFVLLK